MVVGREVLVMAEQGQKVAVNAGGERNSEGPVALRLRLSTVYLGVAG
jgi:hypothetical protein